MENIKISIIIPVYNAEKYLQQCLESVCKQTLPEIEIICINDGSTDNSQKILLDFQTMDSRICILEQLNRGAGYARNLGLSKAQGECIAFLDADDYYPSDTVLEHMYQSLKKHNVAICGGGISLDQGGQIVSGKDRGVNNHFLSETLIEYRSVQYDYGYQRYLFSRELLKEHDICFPPYLRYQDPPFLVRAMVAAKYFYTLTEDTYCYRFGHQNIKWNTQKTEDLVRGLSDVLILSKKNNLPKLHNRCISRINNDYLEIISNELLKKNVNLLLLLIKFNNLIDTDLFSQARSKKEPYIIESLNLLFNSYQEIAKFIQRDKELELQLNAINSSFSYRVGKVVTFIPRSIYRTLFHSKR